MNALAPDLVRTPHPGATPPRFAEAFQPDVFFLGRTRGAALVHVPGRAPQRCLVETAGWRDEAFDVVHFDETYEAEATAAPIDALHWAVSRDAQGALSASEVSVLGTPKTTLAGPDWRIRFKRLAPGPLGLALSYDALFTAVTTELVIKRVRISLLGATVAKLTGFHQRVAA